MQTTLALIIGVVALVLVVVGIVSSLRGRGKVQQRLEQFAGTDAQELIETQDARKRSTPSTTLDVRGEKKTSNACCAPPSSA